MRNLTKKLRSRAAMVIALAYAFCVLASSASLAAGVSPATFHCMAEMSGTAASPAHEGTTHVHADGAAHQHDSNDTPDRHSHSGKADAGNCCGLFCVSAIAQNAGVSFDTFAAATPALPAVENDLAGRAPSPLHRPPIA